MGNVSSRQDDGSNLYIRDQTRFSVAAVTVSNSRGQVLLRVTPNEYPAHSFRVQKEPGDDTPVDYVQDPESANSGPPSFLLRLSNNDELHFTFTFVIRHQGQANGTSHITEEAAPGSVDTNIAGLTYIFASSAKEVENLVVREFHSDPNLHKNPNVDLIGDYTTGGNPSVQFSWTWKWRPPKATEDRGGGWRNTCSFVEYNQRAHRLDTLATFTYWVQNTQHLAPAPRSPRSELTVPPRLRVPSAQSIESRVSNVSDSEGEGSYKDYKDYKEPQSPTFEPIPENNGLDLVPTTQAINSAGNAVKVDVATCKPGEDPSLSEDGPLFRATMRSLEQKTGHMRLRMKKVLRAAEAAEHSQRECNQAVSDFMVALREAASSNANAVKPALDHYFEKIAKEILKYERQNCTNLQRLIIDPISKLYNIEIKQADTKKREFDEESKEYYSYVSKYLGQRSESLKEKQKKQSDEKYQSKRRTFELKRFDYSSFMHDLHGGRKDQEVLSQLTKYADAQARGYLDTAKKVEEMMPQLDALVAEVKAADQDWQLQRTEREEKRRALEKSTKIVAEDGAVVAPPLTHTMSVTNGSRIAESELARSASVAGASALSQSAPANGSLAVQAPINGTLNTPAVAASALSTSPNSKFKGIRDLEDYSGNVANGGVQRKEGLLWALSRPGSHVDPRGINKAAWHKFWIVLDQGRLSEYVNWKEKMDLHSDPIDLRVASVREARNSDRRFCFEIITPHYVRVYQAPSEEDMKSWIGAINNALQSAFELRSNIPNSPSPIPATGSTRKDIAAVLTGKSSSFSGHRQVSNPNRSEAAKAVGRHATTGDKPGLPRGDINDNPASSALLQRVRSADEGNRFCADCGTENKVDWCSINLGVLLCIECSGIHRSLGTHISKVRSLVLDVAVFTPDLVEILLLIGNRVSNMVWEAKLDQFLKPGAMSTREQRLHFITAKYSDRAYVLPSTTTQAPDDHLLTSIKKNDIHAVLHALALRANPNSRDRSRSTHAIFLAMAAADPALPAGAASPSFAHTHSTSQSTLRGVPSSDAANARPTSPTPRKPFPVAELLLQNGAELPIEQAPFPLSQAAQEYIQFKQNQRNGTVPTPATTATAPGSGSNRASMSGDHLTALPTINQGQSLSPSAIQGKERERILKRSSGTATGRSSMGGVEGFVRK